MKLNYAIYSRTAVAYDHQDKTGSIVAMTPIRASKIQRELLGCDTLLSPVRQSARILAKDENRYRSEKSFQDSLRDVNYAYAPNNAVRETYFGVESKKLVIPKTTEKPLSPTRRLFQKQP